MKLFDNLDNLHYNTSYYCTVGDCFYVLRACA